MNLVSRFLSMHGPATTPELSAALGVSASTVSRAVRADAEIVTLGRARTTRHGLRRDISGVGDRAEIYEVTDRPTHLGTLHAVAPDQFVFEPVDGRPVWTPDLPWFLFDLRPSGFLGRQIPELHPQLDVPPDIHRWTSDDVLRYLVRHGSAPMGSLIVGAHHVISARREVPVTETSNFPEMAARALAMGPVGSSAAGEQPKFLARTARGEVLVKFSPRREGSFSRRLADLLVCEHLALETLRAVGRDACRSHVHVVEQRVFLEVERFDRGPKGRRGYAMLAGIDAEFVGEGVGWVAVMEGLAHQGRVSAEAVAEVRWRELFGRWIANSDRHLGNQALWMNGLALGGPTPVYDMLPMSYSPVRGEVVPRVFAPTLDPREVRWAPEVCRAAMDFWRRVAIDARISEPFRVLASENHATLDTLAETLAWIGS